MKKRILSLLLAVLMVVSLFPVTVLAESTDSVEETPTNQAEQVEQPEEVEQTEETEQTEEIEQTEETGTSGEQPEADPTLAEVLARIEALPSVEEFPNMTKDELQAVLDEVEAIFVLTEALTPEQQEQINFSALTAMYAAYDYMDATPVANTNTNSSNIITKAVIENTEGAATAAGVTVHNVTWDDDENCAVFSGSNSYLEIPSALTTLDTSKGFAVVSEVWIDNDNVNWARVFDFNDGTSNHDKYFAFTARAGDYNGYLRTIATINSNNNETKLDVTNSDDYRGKWVKLIWVVKADGSMCLYHDVFSEENLIVRCDATDATRALLTDSSSFDICLIGASAWGSGDGYFKGKMKSFSVHSPYSITATGSLTKGTLSVPTAAFSGEYVTVTGNMPDATEDSVYRLDSITVTDADGGTVPAINTEENTFTFCMPEKNVTISGTVTRHPVYHVTDQVEGGKLILEHPLAAEGDLVSLAVAAGEGTHLSSFTVTDAGGSPVPVTDNTFVMPASAVTVTAEFEAHSYTVIADGKVFKRVCAGEYCKLHTAPTATLTLSENGFKLYEEKLAWKEAGLSVPAVSYYSGETLLEKKPTSEGSYVIKATIGDETAVYPFTLASAPSGYTTDENFRMAYKDKGNNWYDFKGYVDGWQQITFADNGFKAAVYGSNDLVPTAAHEFVADGQAILMTYTVTNNTDAAVNNFRFYVAADTMIAGNDASKNEVDEDNVVTMTNTEKNVILFSLSTTKGGTAVATEYSRGDVSYCSVVYYGADPSTVTSTAKANDSAFVIYFPLTTLKPGESAEYNFVIGMGSEETIRDIIKQVRAALGLVDYENEKITGLAPNTTYIFEYEEEAEGKKEIEITSDDFGEIPLSGQDDQGQGYSFIGKNIKYKEKGSTEEPQEIDVAGRPQKPSSSEILPENEQYAKPEDIQVDDVTETSVKIIPVEGQQYQYSTDGGETWTAVPENGEITGLTSGSTIKIRTRIAATDKAPASEYSDAVSVTLKQAVKNLEGFSATGYTGFQDGQPHSITVIVPEGATVEYSKAADAAYTATNPAFTDPGEYTVYYRVTKEGCYPAYGSEKVTIKNGFDMLGKALKGETVEGAENLFELTDDDNVRTIKLKVDFTADELSELLEIGTTKEIVLDLNGHIINGNGKQGSVINVPSGAKLTLNDTNAEAEHAGYVDANGLWHLGSTVPAGCTAKTVKGGVLTGGLRTESPLVNGGGVVVNGTFNMNGGTIAGNKATHGGGVDVNGTFNMNGGTITGNYATVLGGGVNTNGTVNMYGGEITGNTAATNGGGVCYNNGSVTLGGSANITGNTAASHQNNLWISYMGNKGSNNFVAVAAGDHAPVTEGENKMSVGITLCSEGYNTIPQNYLAGRFTNGNNVTKAMKDCFFADNDDFVMNFNNNSTPDDLTDDYLELAPTRSITNNAPESGKATANGYLTVDKATAAAGETVTITVTPSSGYMLTADSLNVTYNDGSQDQTRQLTQDTQDKTKYTFTMPAYAVTVTAAFEVVPCSTYKFEVTVPETLKVNEEHTSASVKLCVDEEKSLGYEHVLIKVEMTEKPEGSNPKILATDSQSVEWNIAEVGQWGPSEGFAIASNYEATTPLTLKFDKAGTYTAKFTLVDLDNSNAVLCESTATVTVSKNSVTISGLTAANAVYDGQSKTGVTGTVVCTVNSADVTSACGELVYTYYKDSVADENKLDGAPTDAGSYILVVSVPDNCNLYTGSSEAYSFTIERKPITIDWAEDDFTYNGSNQTSSITASYKDVNGASHDLVVAVKQSTTAATFKNAGAYTAEVTGFDTGNDSGYANYALPKTTTRTYNIKPKPVTVTSVPVPEKTYDGTTDTLLCADDPVNAEFSDLCEGETLTLSGVTGKYVSPNAGSQKVDLNDSSEWSLTGTSAANYVLADSGHVKYAFGKIAKANQEDEKPTAPTVSGETVTINESDREKDLEYSIDRENEWITVPALNTKGEFTLSGLTIGSHTIYLRVKEKNNYNASSSVSTEFELTQYSVAYNANGGVGDIASQTANSGSSVTVKNSLGFRRTGYTFTGWNTKGDGTGTPYAVGSTVNEGMMLYAQWRANTYTVRFNANGGTGTMESQTFTYDDNSVSLRENTFTRENYQFVGWATSANGPVLYANNQEVKNLAGSGTVTLYAIWAKNAYKIDVNITSPQSGNVQIKLQQGNAVYAMKNNVIMTNGDTGYNGNETFEGIPAGVYNIVATQTFEGSKNITVTKSIVLPGDGNLNIELPTSGINSKLEVKEDTLPTVVGGLDHEAEFNRQSGMDVSIKMTVEKKAEQQLAATAEPKDKATQDAIKEIKVKANGKTLDFMDIEIEKTTTIIDEGTTQNPTTESINETSKVLELIFSYELNGKKNIQIYREHDGEVKAFTPLENKPEIDIYQDGTFYVDTVNNLIYVYAKLFSTYAIGYDLSTPNEKNNSYNTVVIGKRDDDESEIEENPNTGAPVLNFGAVAVVLGVAYILSKKH